MPTLWTEGEGHTPAGDIRKSVDDPT